MDEGKKGAIVGNPMTAKDGDGDILLYTLTATGDTNTGKFEIDERTGQIKTIVDLDAANNASDRDNNEDTYTVTVTATDPSGAPGSATVTITINNTNDAPTFPTTSVADIEINENVTGDSLTNIANGPYDATDDDADDDTSENPLTYALTGADADAFVIGNGETGGVARGQLNIKKSPDYETKASYSITVTAADDEGAVGKLDVTVTVTNQEDTGSVSLTQRQPQVGRSISASLNEADGSVGSVKWQWYRFAEASGNSFTDALDCAANPNNTDDHPFCKIPNATSPSYTLVAADAAGTADSDKRLAVRVTYVDGHVTDTNNDNTDDGDVVEKVTETHVQASDSANTAPKFNDDQDPNTPGNQADAMRSVAENAKGATVGDAVTATDADTDLLIYSLSGSDAASFTIDSGLNTGDAQGQIKTAVELDYETKKQYTVVVTATDPSGATDTINVKISVTNADDKAVISGSSAISYAENGTGPVGTFTATDQDGDAINWEVTGDDTDDLEISSAGVLTFKTAPDYEKAADTGTDNVYKVTITAAGGEHKVEVTVTDVDESGVVTLDQPQPQATRLVEATYVDQDRPLASPTWQWSRGNSPSGPWMDIANATGNSRTPDSDDVGKYLRATVTYKDKFGEGKTASAVSENRVEARTVANSAPSFSHEDKDADALGNQADRAVDEGKKDANVGKPMAAKDTDGDILIYEITATTDASEDKFAIDKRTGQLTTSVDDLNSDNDGNSENDTATHQVTVKATDPSGASDTAVVRITIVDTNDTPVFPDIDANMKTITIAENATGDTLQLTTYDATDADAGDDVSSPATAQLTYGVTGADADAFAIGNGVGDPVFPRGRLDLKKSPDFETKSSYSITVTATDDEGAVGKLDVTVTVTNQEDEGSVSLTQRVPQVDRPIAASLNETDGNVTTVKWQWFRFAAAATSADDLFAARNTACASGSTGLCAIPNAISPSYIPVKADIKASGDNQRLAALVTYVDGHPTDANDDGNDDGDKASLVTQANVQLSAPANAAPKFADDQDLNTPGNQADAKRSVAENAKGAEVGIPVMATDADTSDKLIYSLSGSDAASFTIDSGLNVTDSEGQIKTAVELDYETKKQYTVVVTATDPSGATDTINVMISVTDEDDAPTIIPGGGGGTNSAPTFGASSATRSVAENTAAGTAIGAPVTATDADGDALTYSVSGADSSSFTIGASSGQLMTSAALDYETKSSYTVTVAASDGTASATIAVTITVTDADEAGFDLNGNGTIERNEVITAIGSYLGGTGGVQRSDVIGLIGRYLSGN